MSNTYYFGRPKSTQNKSPTLKIEQQNNKLVISSDRLARWVYLYRKDGVSMKLNQNYFDILPQSSVTIDIPESLNLSQIYYMEYYTENNRLQNLQLLED